MAYPKYNLIVKQLVVRVEQLWVTTDIHRLYSWWERTHPVLNENRIRSKQTRCKHQTRFLVLIASRKSIERHVVVVRSKTVWISHYRECRTYRSSLNENLTNGQCAQCSRQGKFPNVTCCSIRCSLNCCNRNTSSLCLEILLAYHDFIANKWDVMVAVTNDVDVCVCSGTSCLGNCVRLQNLNSATLVVCKAKAMLNEVACIDLSRARERISDDTTDRRVPESFLNSTFKIEVHMLLTANLSRCLQEHRSIEYRTLCVHLVVIIAVLHNLFTLI
nr:MAG TPA: hypothetical protein [Caudoviricetes sp.]